MFRFKQFTVHQDRCPMKVGTDGVLLGAWTTIRPTDRCILDIGTGTGLIALMLAQRTIVSDPAARITALDIDPASAAQAAENFAASPWPDRLEARCTSVQNYVLAREAQQFAATERLFDLIVSNPPFFTESLQSPDPGRNTARHTTELTFDDLTKAVLTLLEPTGRFALVLPPTEMQRFQQTALGRLFLIRRTDVYPTPQKPVKRILAEFTSTPPAMPPHTDCLTIEAGGPDAFTDDYRRLTRDFYLKF